MRDLVSSRQVTTLISNHTFSNLVLRPNGVHPDTIGHDGLPVGDAPDEAALKRLGARMTAQNGYANIHGWELYDTTGTTEDWSYNATGGFGYTFEIGPDEFHPPFPEVVDEYLGAGEYAGKGNREAYLIALEHAAANASHGRIVGSAPRGRDAAGGEDLPDPDLGGLGPRPPGVGLLLARRALRVAREPLHPTGLGASRDRDRRGGLDAQPDLRGQAIPPNESVDHPFTLSRGRRRGRCRQPGGGAGVADPGRPRPRGLPQAGRRAGAGGDLGQRAGGEGAGRAGRPGRGGLRPAGRSTSPPSARRTP